MARYDLSKIMKRAHNLYKNAHAKYPTFADALRKSWSMAKFEVRVAEERQSKRRQKHVKQRYVKRTSKPLLVRFFFVHKSNPTVSEEKRKPKRNA